MSRDLFFPPTKRLSLFNYVDVNQVQRLSELIAKQLRSQPRTRFLLDCVTVTDFSGYALAELIRLRAELQWQGADLGLLHCTGAVRANLAVPLFESLLADQSKQAPKATRFNTPPWLPKKFSPKFPPSQPR